MDASPQPSRRVTGVVVLTTAMLTFISFWRAGAVVLCDLASSAFYTGGIAEQAIGPCAPWFVLAVMAFSACILAVYVESSSMFVRGGVYKVVREAMGPQLAKVSVSALMFDYVLTGPISSVCAGQYLSGLLNSAFPVLRIGWHVDPSTFSVLFALAVTAFFWRQNIRGIEESSEKSWFIVQLTAVMGLLLFGWSAYSVWARGFLWPPFTVSFGPHALGWLEHAGWAKSIGAVGLLVGIGHSFLGLSGAETLGQVYREMEAPKLLNLKKAAAFVFLFSFLLTVGATFLASSLIPSGEHLRYSDNLLAGLAMHQEGPYRLRLLMQGFVVAVGALILSGAVNTAIVGANSVLGRVAEDGILADWFRILHPRYGTTHRMINLVVALQVVTIVATRGDVYLLGEAYAFGVIWSFVFMTAALVLLRFQNRKPRDWSVPFNVPFGDIRFPVGILAVFLVLLAIASTNLLTKPVATLWGGAFTVCFYAVFHLSERFNEKWARRASGHREKVNILPQESLLGVLDDVERPHRVLIALRDHVHMFALRKALETLDPEAGEIVVLHARRSLGLKLGGGMGKMSPEEEQLFTQIIDLTERQGKRVLPVLVAAVDPILAIAQTAQTVGAREVMLGASNAMTAETQLERLAMAWGTIAQRSSHPVKVTIWRPDGMNLTYTLS
jgi:amino acid transporter